MGSRARREARDALHEAIERRSTITTVEEAEDLALRIMDAAEQIRFDLTSSLEVPLDGYEGDDLADWRIRAQHAVARLELVLSQVQRRKEMLERMKRR